MAVAAPHNGPFFGVSEVHYMAILKDIKQKMFSAINGNDNMTPEQYKVAISRAIAAIGQDEIIKFVAQPFTHNTQQYSTEPNLINNSNINTELIISSKHDTIDKIDTSIISYNNKTLFDNTTDTVKIQKRINGCYVLEGLYIKKHNELITMFKFAKLLYEKFYHTLQTLLYVLSLLNEHECTPGGQRGPGGPGGVTGGQGVTVFTNNPGDQPPPITINLPTPLIKNISALLTDQKTMMDIITKADATLKENGPLNFTKHKGTGAL